MSNYEQAVKQFGTKTFKEAFKKEGGVDSNLDHIVKQWDTFKSNVQAFLVYSAHQIEQHQNYDPVKALWKILQDKDKLKGSRKNIMKEYILEAMPLKFDPKHRLILNPDKGRSVNWKTLSELPWWEGVKAEDDNCYLEDATIQARLNGVISFITGNKVDPKFQEKYLKDLLFKVERALEKTTAGESSNEDNEAEETEELQPSIQAA